MNSEKTYSSLNILLDSIEGTNLLLEYYSDFSKRIFRARDFKSIVGGLYEELRKIYVKQVIEFVLWQNNSELVKFNYRLKDGQVSPAEKIDTKNTLYHYVIEEHQTVLTNNYRSFCENLGLSNQNLPASSWIGIPMLVRGKILGMVAVWDETPEHYFRLQDKQFLSIITNITGFAVENIYLYDYIAEKNGSFDVFDSTSSPVPSENTVESINEYLLQTLLRHPDILYTGLFLRSQSHDKWRCLDEAFEDSQFEKFEEDLKSGFIYLEDEKLKNADIMLWHPHQKSPELESVFDDIQNKYAINAAAIFICPIQHYYYCALVVALDQENFQQVQAELPYIKFIFSILVQLVEKNILLDHKQSYESYIQHLEKLKMVGELASGSAHHLNNILSVISGRSQILVKKLNESPHLRDIKMIEQAAADGALAVRRLQSVKSQSGESQKKEIVNVNDLIIEVIEIVRPRFEREAQSTGITYDVKLTLGSFSAVKGDPAGLREVFLNIINNAFDAMPKGGVLTVQTSYEKNKIFIFISDSGNGVSDEMKEKIFEPFFTTKGEEGNGLGLSIAAEIVSNHQGKIYVDSISEKGSIFMVELPAANKKPSDVSQSSESSDDFMVKVLLVDDENIVGETLAEMLRGEGCEVVTVNNPNDAVMTFVKSDCDVVLTDLSMPGLNGIELAQRIKSVKKSVPIILITGWNQQAQQVPQNNNIIDGIIEKPFNIKQIREEFRKVLKGNGHPEKSAVKTK
jgi:signal transduction histidine kinase/ActR/RegA family two-component response regulator